MITKWPRTKSNTGASENIRHYYWDFYWIGSLALMCVCVPRCESCALVLLYCPARNYASPCAQPLPPREALYSPPMARASELHFDSEPRVCVCVCGWEGFFRSWRFSPRAFFGFIMAIGRSIARGSSNACLIL